MKASALIIPLLLSVAWPTGTAGYAALLELSEQPETPASVNQHPKEWAKVQAQLEQLKKASPPVVKAGADDSFVTAPPSNGASAEEQPPEKPEES